MEQEKKSSISPVEIPKMKEEQLYKIADFACKETGMVKVRGRDTQRGAYTVSHKYVTPPIDFVKMAKLPNVSPALDVSIDAMETNVTGFGWELIPVIDTKEIADGDGNIILLNAKTNEPISDDLFKSIEAEKVELSKLFASSSIEDPQGLLGVFKKKTRDTETIGNAWLEFERDENGAITGIHHLPGWTMRLMKKDKTKTQVSVNIQNPISHEYFKVDSMVKLRPHVQMIGKNRKFFKSFGDPREMNALTGEYMVDGEPFPEDFESANEVIHYSLYHPLYEYGLPRWISATPSILSARAAQIINHRLLTNNGIPMGLIIIEGYQSDQLETKIKEEINQALRGEDSFHSLLVLQVEAPTRGGAGPAGKSIKPTVRIEKLSDLVTDEGMFMEFAKSVDDTIIGTFRLPNLLVGRNNDINRSTAEVAMQVVEEQVFAPERHAHDYMMNSKVLGDMGIRYWKYKTRPASLENIEKRAEIAASLVRTGVLMPREARGVASEIVQRRLSDIDEPWMDMPARVYQAYAEAEATRLEQEGSAQVDEGITKLSEDDREDIVVQIVEKLVKWREGLSVKATHMVKVKDEAS